MEVAPSAHLISSAGARVTFSSSQHANKSIYFLAGKPDKARYRWFSAAITSKIVITCVNNRIRILDAMLQVAPFFGHAQSRPGFYALIIFWAVL